MKSVLKDVVTTLGVCLVVGVLLWAAVAVVVSTGRASTQRSTATQLASFHVSGYAVAFPSPKAQETTQVALPGALFVPGVTVFSEDVATGARTRPVQTDLSGRFRLPPHPPGMYKVCWRAPGFLAGCARPFPVVDEHAYLGFVRIPLQRPPGTLTLHGAVRFADGSIPRTFEPLAGVNAFARVVASVRGQRPRRAFVGNDGTYLLPNVPVQALVRATIESGASARVQVRRVPAGSPPVRRIDLQIANRAPSLEGVVSTAPGDKHLTAALGDTLRITANGADADGDRLRSQWVLPDGTSVPHTAAGATLTHTLPNAAGTYAFEVVTFDGKGGYAKGRVVVRTEGVRFSGTVAGTDRPVLAGATVDIGGRRAKVNQEGFFELVVPERPRFVLNISMPGYALLSRIYDRGLTGAHWTLTRASITSIDPTQGNEVVNVRRPGDCPGTLSDQAKGGDPRPCGPGIRLRIPANALVDATGRPPQGPVDVELSTVDLRAPDAMPGDFTAREATGLRVMESYGAGTVEVRRGPTTYNLAPGTSAELTIPIDPAQLGAGTPPRRIALLSYDERRGQWRREGIAVRSGSVYVGRIRHFSAWNMDVLFQNQACVRLETASMPQSFDLTVKIPSSGGGATKIVQPKITDNGAARFHVLYALPTNENITIEAFEAGPVDIELVEPVPGVPGETQTTFVLTVNTGGPQTPATPLSPVFPYTACKSSVELLPAKLPNASQFLAGFGFFLDAVNLKELDELNPLANPAASKPFTDAAGQYYETIDPQDLRETLTEFRTQNGFTTPAGPNEVEAVYANSADLGFGREMHCIRSGLDVACYVTNYGDRFTDDQTDFVDALAKSGSALVATVGMEYSRAELPCPAGASCPPFPTGYQQATGGGDLRMVKFYVFNKQGARQVAADLDGYGARPVPGLCQTCHGGFKPSTTGGSVGAPAWNPANANSANLNSRFIPFDLSGLFVPVTHNGAPYKADVQDEFKALNRTMVLNTPLEQASVDVLNAMYTPPGTPPGSPLIGSLADQREDFVVPGWEGPPLGANEPEPEDAYKGVVGPSCRTCHISLAPAKPAWENQTVFSGYGAFIDSLVCKNHTMPHALVTHNRFWLSLQPHQPLLLHDFLNGINPPGQGTASDCRR